MADAKGRNMVWVVADASGTRFRFQGAAYFYGNKDVREACGLSLWDEKDTDTTGDKSTKNNKVFKATAENKAYLIRLVAVMKPDSAVGGQATQEDKPARRYEFYCSPENVNEAMELLPKTRVDASLLPGNYKIVDVYRKLQISKA